MRCLVTGGAGFIGSNLATALENQEHEVVILDNFSSGNRANLSGFKGEVMDVDISKPLDFGGRFDAIFHQAAITDPRYPNDRETIRQNLDGFELVLALAQEQNAKLVYASTASLYGNGPAPQKEDQPKELFSAYAQSKLIMDEMASHHYADRHIVGLRYFNVFGPGEGFKGRAASMIYHLAKQMKQGKRPRIFKWGEHQRDHIYVKDCVLANLQALEAASGVYNVGTGVATSFKKLTEILNEVMGTGLEPEYFDMPYDPRTYQNHTQADVGRAESLLGFKARYGLKEAIKEYLPLIT
jgi:ADP-L-glycero-D-manno-heptose 6-epimerase